MRSKRFVDSFVFASFHFKADCGSYTIWHKPCTIIILSHMPPKPYILFLVLGKILILIVTHVYLWISHCVCMYIMPSVSSHKHFFCLFQVALNCF